MDTRSGTIVNLTWRRETLFPLVLGTAQLGTGYGIANRTGSPEPGVAKAIVECAWHGGVRFFDTAQAYGASEMILGKALEELGVSRQARIISKLSPSLDPTDPEPVHRSIQESCRRLGVDQLWGIMLHRPQWLESSWARGLGGALCRERSAGAVRYLGTSVYTPDEARRALKHPEIDIIQIPCNAWDQRAMDSGVFELARSLDKLCFVRSVYLQGLLTMSPEDVRRCLPQAWQASKAWHEVAARMGLTTLRLALRFGLALGLPLVIGAETPAQVLENLMLIGEAPLAPEAVSMLRQHLTPLVNAATLNPSLWEL